MSLTDVAADNTSTPISLAGSVIATGLAMSLALGTPLHQRMSWTQVGSATVGYLAFTAAVHAAAIVILRTTFREHVHTGLERLLWTVWIPVVWLPLLGVLTIKNSFWVLLLLPLIALLATGLLIAERITQELIAPTGQASELFAAPAERPELYLLLPALGASACLHAALAAFGADDVWLSGLCVAAACVIPARALMRMHPVWVRRRTAASSTVLVLVLTWAALLPLLLSARYGFAAKTSAIRHGSPASKLSGRARGLSGIILTMPPKPASAVAAPGSSNGHAVAGKDHEQVIPFTGEYWYFKQPLLRPGRDARTEPGDPLKAHIRSTDELPLRMSAHQAFITPLALDGARVMRLQLTNADNRPGTVAVQVELEMEHGPSLRLGPVTLLSSLNTAGELHRAPVTETVQLRFPKGQHEGLIRGITIRFLPDQSRSLAGVQVSVRSFKLER